MTRQETSFAWSTPQDLIKHVDGNRVDLLGTDDVAGSRDLLVRVPEQARCERETRRVLDECRGRAAVDVRRVLIDLHTELLKGLAVVVDEGPQEAFVIADADWMAVLRREKQRFLPPSR